MRWPKDTIVIKKLTTTVDANEDITESYDSGTTVKAIVKHLDGTRYLKAEELIDRSIYSVECFDNNFPNSIKIEYGGLTLYPIRPWTKNQDRSMMIIAKIIMATKV